MTEIRINLLQQCEIIFMSPLILHGFRLSRIRKRKRKPKTDPSKTDPSTSLESATRYKESISCRFIPSCHYEPACCAWNSRLVQRFCQKPSKSCPKAVVEQSEIMPSIVQMKPTFPDNAATREYAASLDAADPLGSFRHKFIIPSKANITAKKLAKPGEEAPCERHHTRRSLTVRRPFPDLSPEPCIYFCGNSLGIQPKAVAKYMEAQLDTWSSIGVSGHFRDLEDSPLPPWQLMSEQAAASMSRIVGAAPAEVAAMGTLTANLHILLASFYKPTASKYKILMDWKAFPSDHVSVASVTLEPRILGC